MRLLGILVLLPLVASFGASWTAGQSAAAASRAAVYVSPSGNDAKCARGDSSKPCATLPVAYQKAKSGDVVQVAAGTYTLSSDQTIAYDPSKVNASLSSPCADADRVTFRKAPGGADPLFTDGNFGRNDVTLAIQATCLTFDGIDINISIYVKHNSGPSDNPSDITFENGVYDHNVGGTVGGSKWSVNGNYITFKNIEVGPACCDTDGMDIVGYPNGVAYGITMDHVFIHDIVTDCSQLSALANWSNCASESQPNQGNHVDCVQTLGMGDWTVMNSRILNCTGGGGAALQQGVYWPDNTYFNVLWENNVFSGSSFGMGCGGPSCETTYGNNYVFKATVPPGYPDSGTRSYFKILYNTIEYSTGGGDLQPGGDYQLVGNIETDAGDGTGCRLEVAHSGEPAGATWSNASYNMFASRAVATACNKYGTGNSNGTATYVDSAHQDWHLASGSAGTSRGGIGLQPRRDLDGRLRPLRYPTAVGAYATESAAISFGGGIGELRLGMSRAAVTARYGDPRRISIVTRRPGVRAVATYARHGGNVWVSYDPQLTVVGLSTNSRYFTMPAGLGPGAPRTALQQMRPPFRTVCHRHTYRRMSGSVAVDLEVPRENVTRMTLSRVRVAPACR